MPWSRSLRLVSHATRVARAVLAITGCVVTLATFVNVRGAQAQLLLIPEDAGPRVFPVSRIELEVSDSRTGSHSVELNLAELLPVSVELQETQDGWTAPASNAETHVLKIGGAASDPVRLTPSGLARTLRSLVSAVNETGLYGVDIRPAASDIDLETERDLRPKDTTRLRLVLSVGHVGRVRTIAVGNRIRSDWKINNELHEEIRDQSPILPLDIGNDDTTDLLDRDALEDYLYRLNRHAGRRVEAALSPDEEPGKIVLDYRVAEAKPWFAYAQVSNTGTRRTSNWQTRVGAVHRQLSNRDDVLSIEYLNGGADVNGIRAKYEAPFFGPKRPDWMKRRTGDPAWIDWLPREKIPWWGVDRLRWNLDLSYGRFEAGGGTSLSLIPQDAVVSEQFQFGGQFIYEAFQHKNFFIDAIVGARLRNLRVTNKINQVDEGKELFLLPRAAIRAQRINAVSNFNLELGAGGQVLETNADEIENLGRQDVDGRYANLDFNLGYSTYLEPVLFPRAFKDPETRLSSTLAHEIALGLRGQYAFDYRLIPQASQILGGLYSVRGFKQSQAVGDTVVISSFEYRFHLPRALPIMREPLNIPLLGDFRATPQQVYGRPDWDFTLRAFVDVGRAIRNSGDVIDSITGTKDNTFEDNETMVGVGFGAELQFRSNLRARVDWATPLTPSNSDNDANDPNNRVRFGETSEVHLLFSILY